jgi:hypothetical protein
MRSRRTDKSIKLRILGCKVCKQPGIVSQARFAQSSQARVAEQRLA